MTQQVRPRKKPAQAALTVLFCTLAYPAVAATVTVDFEELPFHGVDYYNGADLAEGFTSQNVFFNNQYTDYGSGCCWNGWAYSRKTDRNTPGPGNQYSAWPGLGAHRSTAYGIAFSGSDAGGGLIPTISLPAGAEPKQISIANTTYAALSMQNGDGFAKQFGGPTGNDPDWLRLTIEGLDSNGALLADTSIYLADYRPADAADDTILAEWTEIDLSPLADLGVATLAFRLASTDTGQFGMNTPAYFAADNLVLEPATMRGDFDQDGDFDEFDLIVWQQTYGDLNGADLIDWQRSWTPSTAVNSAPEPTMPMLVALGLIGGFAAQRRRG